MDLNILCRLCAKEDRLCIQVFGTEGIKQNVAKKIRLCLPIIVKETDDFPKQICLNCLSNLDTSYELYTRCLEAQSVIKNMMKVNRQNSGEVVKVYTTQEMLKMVNELREKMCEKRPAVRLGNTVYTIRDSGSQADDSTTDEHRAKKRKQEVMKAGGRGMVYPVGPLGQQYMLMPSTTMPPAVMIPSAVPHGQFAIAPLPTVPTYPIPPIQAVPQTPVSTSEAQANNPEMPVLTPELIPQTKATTTSSTQIVTLPSSISVVRQPSAAEVVSVQSVQNVPRMQTAQPSTLSQVSTPKVQQPSTRKHTSVSESTVEAQITSIQSAIQAFQNSSPAVQPTISAQVPASSKFILTGKTLQPLQNTSVSSETTAQIVSIQNTVQALPQITIRTKQERDTQDVEEPSSEILPLITNDVLGPKEPLSTNTQQASTQGSKSTPVVPMVNMGGGDDDDDDDEYAADDPDPLQDDSEEETQDKTEDEAAVDKTATESAPEPQVENRDVTPSVVEEVSGDGSAAGGQVNTHLCPYCNKYFPEDVIFHHKKLHFRQKFFSCITCNKNFRTEAGLESHRCD